MLRAGITFSTLNYFPVNIFCFGKYPLLRSTYFILICVNMSLIFLEKTRNERQKISRAAGQKVSPKRPQDGFYRQL